jgi:hypothetical protein
MSDDAWATALRLPAEQADKFQLGGLPVNVNPGFTFGCCLAASPLIQVDQP